MIQQTFLGIPEPPADRAKAVIVPVPYDAMTSYVPGTRFGPDAIIRASQEIETYDTELKRDFEMLPVIMHDPILPERSSPEAMINAVEEVISEIAESGKMPILLGGDHSLSIAPTRYFHRIVPSIGILHVDAHSDLRASYQGSSFSHACAMRHVYDAGAILVQVGIRSSPQEVEEECVEHRKVFWAPSVPVGDILAALPEKIYISFDVDALDPSIMPATGTPEPGGISWYDALALLRAAATRKQVLGFDLMEFSPMSGFHYPEFTAARLLAKFLGYLLT